MQVQPPFWFRGMNSFRSRGRQLPGLYSQVHETQVHFVHKTKGIQFMDQTQYSLQRRVHPQFILIRRSISEAWVHNLFSLYLGCHQPYIFRSIEFLHIFIPNYLAEISLHYLYVTNICFFMKSIVAHTFHLKF